MGADIIGWRNCPLQVELGQDGFLAKLKLRAYAAAVESQVPEGKRDGIQVEIQTSGRATRSMTYREIRAGAEGFARGIPECASCLIARGKPLGCYNYVTYPIDEEAERLLFEFFVSQVATRDSICDQLYRDIVSRVPRGGGWHTQRGAVGTLARLAKPLEHSWGSFFSKKRLDSAQILASLFITQDQLPVVVAFAVFWSQFLEFAKPRASGSSRTLAEIEHLAGFYLLMSASAVSEAGTVLIDG